MESGYRLPPQLQQPKFVVETGQFINKLLRFEQFGLYWDINSNEEDHLEADMVSAAYVLEEMLHNWREIDHFIIEPGSVMPDCSRWVPEGDRQQE